MGAEATLRFQSGQGLSVDFQKRLPGDKSVFVVAGAGTRFEHLSGSFYTFL
jgi:hypothetical protein